MMYGRGYGYGYGNMMNGYGWVGGLVMLLFALLVIAGVVLVILWAMRAASGHHAHGASAPPPANVGHDEAVAIAKRRLASGEITKDQYEEIIRTLGG